MNKEDKTVERMDKMIEQLSLITNAAEELIRIVSECPILVVGHNPYLNELINEMINVGKFGFIDIKKGELARIRITNATTTTTSNSKVER